MYRSTEAFENLVQQDSRTFKVLLTYENVSVTKVKNIKFTGGSESEDDFSIGSTMSQYIEVTIPDGNLLIEGKEIFLQVGMDVNGLEEYVPIGYFTAGKPKKADDQIVFTAYDRMMNTERPFSMNGTTTTTVEVLKTIEEITGIPVVTSNLASIPMNVPRGYSCREVLSYVSQFYGAFATCNRTGRIELRTYEDSDYKVEPGRYWDNFEHNDYTFNVSKLVCNTGQDKDGNSISISAGSGTRSVSFYNPFMTQTILNDVITTFEGFSYMPGTVKMLGDPRLDVWDVLTIKDLSGNSYKVPAMKVEWEYDGGLTYSIEAVGLSEEETNMDYKGPKIKEMDRYYAELVLINQAIINKLDVDTANITYATIKDLDVVKETVQELHGELGDFKDLTATNFEAANAKFSVLDADYANIKTLLLGSAGVGDLENIHLTSQNATIESTLIKTAVMQTVTIADLLAGDISTNKFRILSDDGGILIQGATQQWKDTDGTVRMQAGRDAKGNFTFCLFDSDGKGILIDSTGVKPEAIAEGLIIDKMVSGDANISAKKLDIASIFTEINASTETIKASRIWLDEQNQNLNQIYSQIKSDQDKMSESMTTIESGYDGLRLKIENLTDDVTTNSTEISAIQGKISALISESEITELENGKTTMYSRLNSVEQTVSGFESKISDLKTQYDTVSGQYTSLDSKVAEYKASADEFSSSLTSLTTRIDNDYSTTETIRSMITQETSKVEVSVSNTYATKDALSTTEQKVTNLESWKNEASLKITDSAIVSTVKSSSEWETKADKASLISEINQSSEKITIKSNKISLEGTVTANSYFKVNTDGSIAAIYGTIGGWKIKDSSLSSGGAILSATDGSMQFGTGKNKVCKQDSDGTLYYTEYTNDDNYSGLLFGRTGIKAYSLTDGIQEIWINGVEPDSNWILKYTKKKVTINADRINSDTVYTKGCSFGNNITTNGTLSVGGKTGLKGDAYVAGAFTFRDYKEEDSNTSTRRRPVASASNILNRVAYLSSSVQSGKAALTISAQWGSSNYTTKVLYNDSASDVRLKKNIENSKVCALMAVMKMQVRSFDWKTSEIHQKIGLVADEIEKIDPLLTAGGGYNKDGSMNIKQIDRLLLTEYAIKAIQELTNIVRKQNKRIKTLERMRRC